jgi:arginine deiminase
LDRDTEALVTSDRNAAAYGGAGWVPRTAALREELGTRWAACGADSEWAPLRQVLLHAPGAELAVADADAALMLARPDPERARRQHDALAAAYREAGIDVAHVEPPEPPPPNQLYVADLLFMTPEGAIVGRPAGEARAGEERWVARRLAELGIPILRTVGARGVFEGADALWLDRETVLLGRGLRTNAAGAAQVAATLAEQGVSTIVVDLLPGTMHLMGELRIVDRDLAYCRAGRLPGRAVRALEARGYTIQALADGPEVGRGAALNVVALGPRRIVMPAGRPATRARYEAAGVACVEVEVDELLKAAGGIGCLTGVLRRQGSA